MKRKFLICILSLLIVAVAWYGSPSLLAADQAGGVPEAVGVTMYGEKIPAPAMTETLTASGPLIEATEGVFINEFWSIDSAVATVTEHTNLVVAGLILLISTLSIAIVARKIIKIVYIGDTARAYHIWPTRLRFPLKFPFLSSTGMFNRSLVRTGRVA